METTVIRKKRRESRSDRIFYAVNLAILFLLAAIVVYPLYFIVIASISNADAVLGGRVFLYPVDITLVGYSKIVERTDVWRGYLNTIIYTFLSTLLSLFVTILAGWALSRKNASVPQVFHGIFHHHHVFRRRTDPFLQRSEQFGTSRYHLGDHPSFGAVGVEPVYDKDLL